LKRILSFILIASVFFSTFSSFTTVLASKNNIDSLGYITSMEQELLSYGLVYTELAAENDSKQKAYIFEYSPNRYTLPQVEYGSNASSKVRLKDITSRYEKNGMRVVGALNGDFFSFSTGVPMGVVIKDGIIISSDPSKNAIGFEENGFAVIGNPDIHFVFSCTPENVAEKESGKVTDASDKTEESRVPYSFTVDYFNKYPSVYAIYFLNDFYSKSTRSSSPSTEVILKPVSGQLRAGEKMSFEVTAINYNAIDSEIPEGHYVLCGDDRSFASSLEAIQTGDILSLEIQANNTWKSIQTALGGGDIIVKDGAFVPETVDEAHEKLNNPRTAIGICENNDVVFFANDGRDRKNAVGVTLETLANIMLEMGCKTVINLDGGGSTTVYATTPFDTAAKLVNNPSDGSERHISNAILFINNLPPTDITGGVKITDSPEYIMVGSTLKLDTIYHDTTLHPFTPKEETRFTEHNNNGKSYGEFDGNVFTALSPGKTTLAAINGNTKGLKTLNILSSPTEFISANDEIVVEIGNRFPLDIKANYSDSEVLFNNIDVVNYHIKETTYKTENSAPHYFSSVGYISDNAFYADEYFDGILEIYMEDTSLEIPLKVIPEIYKNDILSKDVKADLNGESVEILDADESYLGKEFFTVTTPADENNETSLLTLECKGEYSVSENAKSFTFLSKNDIIASLVLTDEEENEILIPYTVERNYSVFNGWLKYKADLSSGDYDDSQKYTVKYLIACNTQPENEYIFGGLCEITGKEVIYSDIENSWAKEHITDVYYQELMKGKPYYTTNIFDGSAHLTRAEFATVLCRFLNLDLTKYTDASIVFADIDTVGSWAWSQIGAMSSLGLMNGSLENDGKHYFRPQDGITRAEAMQVIGRLLTPCENTVSLNFSDTDEIPAWALENTLKVVTYNIFSGYEDNTIKPFNKLTRNEAAKILSLFNTKCYHDLLELGPTADSIPEQTEIPGDEA